ncbi:unnamed protein product [Arctogadus glacialis]
MGQGPGSSPAPGCGAPTSPAVGPPPPRPWGPHLPGRGAPTSPAVGPPPPRPWDPHLPGRGAPGDVRLQVNRAPLCTGMCVSRSTGLPSVLGCASPVQQGSLLYWDVRLQFNRAPLCASLESECDQSHKDVVKDVQIAGLECCPSCPPGWHVVKDCAERSITKCSWCPGGTFQAGFNEQKQCSTCTKCDAGLGLKVKRPCTPTSDAVCETLDGFFCSDSNRGGCRAAQRHRLSCSPGQYIGQRGTADKDTECLHCTDGTFSDGTRSSCKNHTKCDSVGEGQIQPGTDSTDSTCIKYVAIMIIGCMLFIVPIIVLGGEAAGERTAGPSSASLLSMKLPAGLETSIPPMKHSLQKKLGCQTQ